jgi:hypothetical protein
MLKESRAKLVSLIALVVLVAVVVGASVTRGLPGLWIAFSISFLLYVGVRVSLSRFRWKMAYWFVFSVLFALLPILAVILLRWLSGSPPDLLGAAASTEAYLFAAILGSACLGEVLEIMVLTKREIPLHPLVLPIHVLVLSVELLLLGAFFHEQITRSSDLIARNSAILTLGILPLTVALSGTLRLASIRSHPGPRKAQ